MTDSTSSETGPAVRPLSLASMIMVAFAVLATFGGIVAYVTLNLREDIRSRILERAASSFEQVVTSEYQRAEEVALLENAELIEMDLIDLAVSSEEIIDEIAFWSIEMPLVQSIAIHDLDGEIRRALPGGFDLRSMDQAERDSLAEVHSGADFLNESMDDLVVNMAFVPEEGSEPTGYARFVLDATAVTEELVALDDNLRQQAGTAFGAGALIIAIILWFSFHRLCRSSVLLAQRGRKLGEMNERLILASKSAALGSVTAHLMHGLKNPLAGLREYVKDRETTDPADEEVGLVSQAARSMQAMVEEALQVLQDQETEGISYAFTAEEMCTLLEKRLSPLAEQREIALRFPQTFPDFSMDNLKANLILLALFNLGQNAIEATPKKGEVRFTCEKDRGNQLFFRVRDDGPGLPEHMLEAPFAPRPSSKQGGTGVGLAISQQLAERADAELTLEDNGTGGACFLLVGSSESVQDDD